MPKKPCASDMSPAHSPDIAEVWHGCATPVYVCGYHLSRGALPAIFAAKHAGRSRRD